MVIRPYKINKAEPLNQKLYFIYKTMLCADTNVYKIHKYENDENLPNYKIVCIWSTW